MSFRLPVFIIAVLALCASAVVTAWAQEGEKISPDTPIRNFRLPGFDDDSGNRVWLLAGEEARIKSKEEIEVTAMVLKTYASDDPVNAQTTIQSPLAVIYPNEGIAWGSSLITIHDRHDAYSIVGEDWVWNNEQNKVTINQNARVTFRESLGSIIE